MQRSARLYESAGARSERLKPLWHVESGQMLFAGCLKRNALHSHSASVLLAGLYDDIRLRIDGGDWFSCRAAVIRAGTAYEFDAGGRPLAVIYVEPNETAAEGLAALLQETREAPGALIGARCDLALIQTLYEDPLGLRWVGEAMADLIAFSKIKARRMIDERVRQALSSTRPDEREAWDQHLPNVTAAAKTAGLSTSRFQHLFKKEVGVAYSRYAAWSRMRIAVSEVVKGSNLTTAAHAAGFYDQSHFAHEFRRTFGAPASRSLADIRS
jgi:AraC-like DNA-binding protein